jgi:hypothetical protein
VVSEFHRVARSRLDAGVGQKSHDHDMGDAVLFELEVEIGVREAALPPMLLDNNVTF